MTHPDPSPNGLTAAVATQRHLTEGPNELAQGFGFTALSPGQWLAAMAAGLCTVVPLQLLKSGMGAVHRHTWFNSHSPTIQHRVDTMGLTYPPTYCPTCQPTVH